MANKTQTDTKTRSNPTFDFDNIFRQHTFSAPTTNPNRQANQQDQTRTRRAPQPLDAMTPAAGVAVPQINTTGLEADDIDDATAARNAGRVATDAGVDPEPRPPGTDLAVITRAIATANGVQPNFRSVSDLPGYMKNAIRRIGRTVFSVYTTTPIEDIDVLANVGGQGPNTQRELNAVAGWARNNATLDQQASEAATADFGDVIPGYAPQIQVYTAGDTTFMVTRDDHGDYIYSWPTNTNVGFGGDRLEQPRREAPALNAPRTGLPHLENKQMDFKSFLVLFS